jgi:hypothetical protein
MKWDTINYLISRYNLDITQPSPIEIPNIGRDVLGDWFKDLGFREGTEIGVERGLNSEQMLQRNPTMRLHCIDPWHAYPGYKEPSVTRNLKIKYEDTVRRLSKYDVVYHKTFSKHAARAFQPNSLDFVYIDGNHDLPWVMDDIIMWHERVRPGGIVAGHDYIRSVPGRRPTELYVVEAVNWFTTLKPILVWFLLGTKAKVAGEVRDRNRSWLWVKE